ncbi:MAG: C39 family peptidase [Anaerolineales bacterium]
MFKKVIFLGVCFFVMVAAVGPEVAAAGVDPLASPTPQPTSRIAAPEIIGINPVVALSEGNQGESHPSDILIPNQIYIPFKIDLPGYVDPAPLPDPAHEGQGIYLDVPQRTQSTGEVSCGPAALGMALDYLSREQNTNIPSTEQLRNFLFTRELMYEWGTGVEELAFGARHYGFPGSYAFHNWTLEQLAAELKKGYPVVLALGTNGPDQPGHFVTLTGLAADGSWVRVNDPLIGEVIYRGEEFQELWGAQGNSGLVPLQTALAPEEDPMLPWMGVFSALSMLGLMFTQAGAISKPRFISDTRKWLTNPRRKGIGGGPLPPEVPETLQIPRYEEKIIFMGLKTIQQEVPVYETRQVKVGIRGVKKEIPQYENKKVQVGFSTITKNIPVYKTEKVRTGTKLVKKEIPVTKYRTKKVLEWKKIIRKIPDYHYIGSKRFLVGYKTETRWKRVLVNKRVPYQTTKTITHQVPVYKEKKVVSGYRTVTEKVPKYEQQRILVGYKTIFESEPVFEEQRVQVGTKTVTRQVPNYKTVRVLVGYDNEINGSDPDNDDPRDVKLFEKLVGGSSRPAPPAGIVAEVKDLKDRWWLRFLKTFQENVINRFLYFKEHPDEVLKGLDPDKLPKLLSLSAKAAWDFHIFSQEGAILSTNTPHELLQIYYMTQKFSIEPKAVVTVNPGSLIDFYFTSGTGSVKLTKNLSYIFGPGEWGYSINKPSQNSEFDYILTKHLIGLSLKGITYKFIEEEVFIDPNKTTDQYQVKLISSVKCETKTIKTEGIILAAIVSAITIQAALALAGTSFIYQLIPSLVTR